VRFRLPEKWRADVSYADLEKKQAQHGVSDPTPQQVFEWVCEIRRAKLPNPQVVGNAGSFFEIRPCHQSNALTSLRVNPGWCTIT
jgi:UDP-N-acetylmuramate dehydrogenase